MIIHNKIKHSNLREQFEKDGILKTLETIRLDNIEDLETKIICRTLLHSYQTLIDRIKNDEEIKTDEKSSA